MKIEIHSPEHPTGSHSVYQTGKEFPLSLNSGINPRNISEDQIEVLIGEREYKKFTSESKYAFDVPAWKVKVLTGDQPARTREQLLFEIEFEKAY